MRASVLVSAVRTPTGKLLGVLKDFTAPELGGLVVAEAVRRAGIDAEIVDECLMGNVVSAGEGQNPARQAALKGGLPDHVAAVTINKVCGSGLKAVMFADQAIRAGDIDIAVAGGMESASHTPFLLQKVREGLRLGNSELLDSMIVDGLCIRFLELRQQSGHRRAEGAVRQAEDLVEARREIDTIGEDIPIPEAIIGAARGQRVAFLARPQPRVRLGPLHGAGDEAAGRPQHVDLVPAPGALGLAVVEAEKAPVAPA